MDENLVRCDNGKTCPAGHYCDHTHLFSVCCPTDMHHIVPSLSTDVVSITSDVTQSPDSNEVSSVTPSPTIRISTMATATPTPDVSGSGQYSDLSGSGQYSDLSGSGQYSDFDGSGQLSESNTSGKFSVFV